MFQMNACVRLSKRAELADLYVAVTANYKQS